MTNRLLALPLRWHVAALGVLALGVSGIFGGLDRVAAAGKDVPTIPLGQTVEGGPWRVTVTGITLIKATKPIIADNTGDHFLAVLATIEVTADESRNDLGEIVRLRGVNGIRTEKPQYIWFRRDGEFADYLHPGMPEEIAFFWAQAPDATNAARLEVEVYGRTYRDNSLTYNNRKANKMWLDPAVRARVMVPVKDNRAVVTP